MILYFSGTGNSAYVANYIGNLLDDAVINLFDHLKKHNYSRITSDRPWVFVVPTYAWQLPRIVRDWITRTELVGNINVYFVMTCGDAIGNAGHFADQLCKKKYLNYMGCAEIVMPENYIAIYDAPEEAEAERIIQKAETSIQETAEQIKSVVRIPDKRIRVRDIIKSGLVNAIFYPCIVSAKKFYALDQCISCGQCERVCPLSNITLMNGKPSWGKDCTHCMACICTCPKEAIEYGKGSKGKRRYTCNRR